MKMGVVSSPDGPAHGCCVCWATAAKHNESESRHKLVRSKFVNFPAKVHFCKQLGGRNGNADGEFVTFLSA